MDDKEWQLFLSKFPEEDKQMLRDSDFQDAVLMIYADSKSEEEAHIKIKELIRSYRDKQLELDLWLRTHPLQKLRIYISCVYDKIKYNVKKYSNKY